MSIRTRQKWRKNSGALLLSAVVLITVFGFLGVTVAHIAINSQGVSQGHNQSSQAFYLASTGLQQGTVELRNNFSWASPTTFCDGNWKTTQSLDNGEFRFKCDYYTGAAKVANSPSLGPADTIVYSSTLTGFAPNGRITINSEDIDYYGTAAAGSEGCGAASVFPCFLVKTRGANGTTAATHTFGAVITQAQPTITAEGAVPNVSDPAAKSTQSQSIALRKMFIVGNESSPSTDPVFMRGSQGYWENLNEPSGGNTYGVSMVNYTDGWAVGNSGRTYQYNGTTWTFSVDTGRGLRGVSCLASNNCWAGGGRAEVTQYTGSWGPRTDVGGGAIRDMECITGNTNPLIIYECYAPATDGRIYKYTQLSGGGSSWTLPLDDLGGEDVLAVHCLAWDDCWAVGQGGEIFHKKTTDTWTKQDIGGESLQGVFCTSTNNCWAVDNAGGIFHYTNSGGSELWPTSATYSTSDPLYDVACMIADECYAVGNGAGDTARILHWDGTSWIASTGVPSFGVGENPLLRRVSIPPGSGPSVDVIAWQES